MPNQESFKIVNALHQKGVKQVIFSNISKQSFCKLIRLYPKHFSYFDLRKSMANAQGIFTRKPHAKYIKKFLKKNKIAPSNIIFFDDKAKNIAGARRCGIDAHVFKKHQPAIEILRRNRLI